MRCTDALRGSFGCEEGSRPHLGRPHHVLRLIIKREHPWHVQTLSSSFSFKGAIREGAANNFPSRSLHVHARQL